MHPQINLYSVMRKRFIHLVNDELHASEDVPWGEDALLTFVFFEEHPEGRYGVVASNGKYLSANGKLVAEPNADCQFLLGFYDDQISLRDAQGRFLSAVGAQGQLKVVAPKAQLTKDELFKIQDSMPQFTILDNRERKDGKRGTQVSVRSGVEVKADQADVTDQERFQLEVNGEGKSFFLTNKLFYWTVGADGVVSAANSKKEANSAFTVEYHDNFVKFVASNGKYVITKPNGALVAAGNGSEDNAKFVFTIINRPELVLRSTHGFLAVKGASGRVECNKSRPEIFQLESKDGAYHIKYKGKYWTVDNDGVVANSSKPHPFFLQFINSTLCLVKDGVSGKYLEGEQNGGLKATGAGRNANTTFEF